VPFEFVTAENYQALRPVILEHDLNEFLSKRSCAACDQNNLI
jgi:hypothetical protein